MLAQIPDKSRILRDVKKLKKKLQEPGNYHLIIHNGILCNLNLTRNNTSDPIPLYTFFLGQYYNFYGETVSLSFYNGSFSKKCEWQAFQAVIFDWTKPIPNKILLSELYGTDRIFPITSLRNNKRKWIFENNVGKMMQIKIQPFIVLLHDFQFSINICAE